MSVLAECEANNGSHKVQFLLPSSCMCGPFYSTAARTGLSLDRLFQRPHVHYRQRHLACNFRILLLMCNLVHCVPFTHHILLLPLSSRNTKNPLENIHPRGADVQMQTVAPMTAFASLRLLHKMSRSHSGGAAAKAMHADIGRTDECTVASCR